MPAPPELPAQPGWRRWLPSRLSHRLVLVALLAILLLQAALWFLYSMARTADVSLAVAAAVVEQSLALDQLLDRLPVAHQQDLVAAFRSPLVRAELRNQAPPAATTEAGRGKLARELATELKASLFRRYPELAKRGAKLYLAVNPGQSRRSSHTSPEAQQRSHRGSQLVPAIPVMVLALPRADGPWLVVSVSPAIFESRLSGSGPGFLFGLLFLGSLVLVGVVWASGRVARPLRHFAAAAERFSRDQAPQPLVPSGPREVREAITAFNRMQEKITRLLNDRSLTLAAISHDIRTALTRLRLRVEFLPDPEAAPLVQELDELTTLLDNSLALVRAEVEPEATTLMDLSSLLDDLADELELAGHHVPRTLPARLPLQGRPLALKRVFRNLLDNAVRHGSTAAITASAAAGGIRVEVADAGPGLPEAELEQVFRPFYRLEASRNRSTGGSGLGLAIARGLVHSHGGEITLANRPEGGLLVTVTLPAAPVPTQG